MQSFTTKTIDMVITDLPYGTTACKWDSVIDLHNMWNNLERICKDKTPYLFTCSQPFTTKLGVSKINWLRYEWIWEKPQGTNPLTKEVVPLKSHENILVFYKKAPKYYPQKTMGNPYRGFKSDSSCIGEVFGKQRSKHRSNITGERFPKTVLKFPQERGLHPTQKPIPLMEYLIKTYSDEGDTILDICMGSGTTGVAAVKNNRNFIGIEKDQKYFELAKNRIETVQQTEDILKQFTN